MRKSRVVVVVVFTSLSGVVERWVRVVAKTQGSEGVRVAVGADTRRVYRAGRSRRCLSVRDMQVKRREEC